ncbi:MAG: phosphoenolpyruvate hydrolase family protein, partial [Planctomycetota bacterium]
LAALCGTDPLRLMERFLEDLRSAGYAGILNWPSVGLIDGTFRAGLEAANLGYDREVQAVRTAAGSGLLAAACVFSPDQAGAMAQAGAEVLVVHPGLGARSREEIHRRVRDIAHAAREARAGAIVLAHAGPLRAMNDFEALWTEAAELDGFFGGGLFGKEGRPRLEEVALLKRPPGRRPLAAAREV